MVVVVGLYGGWAGGAVAGAHPLTPLLLPPLLQAAHRHSGLPPARLPAPHGQHNGGGGQPSVPRPHCQARLQVVRQLAAASLRRLGGNRPAGDCLQSSTHYCCSVALRTARLFFLGCMLAIHTTDVQPARPCASAQKSQAAARHGTAGGEARHPMLPPPRCAQVQWGGKVHAAEPGGKRRGGRARRHGRTSKPWGP